MYVLGMDAGSTTTKAIVFAHEKVLASTITLTSGDISGAARRVLIKVGAKDLYRRKELGAVVTTGSGRAILAEICAKNFKGLMCKAITEITCHGTGAYFICPDIRMVVDIGGQDSKVIRISDGGTVESFVMNDKCAAGTGRFFEVIANVLDLDMEKMVKTALRARRSVEITNTCAVFAESEIISHLAAGKSKPSILAGLHESIAQRIFSLMRLVGLASPVIMTGGVARNRAMVRALERKVGNSIIVAPSPQMVGALGAAIIAENSIRT
jgi:predicted CoA-substrate-specific enzyme activase